MQGIKSFYLSAAAFAFEGFGWICRAGVSADGFLVAGHLRSGSRLMNPARVAPTETTAA